MRLWKPIIALIHVLSSLAMGAGESERVIVASAKVRAALALQAELPDQPPNVVLPNVPKPKPGGSAGGGLSLEITGEPLSVLDEATGRFKVTAYSGRNCIYCKQAHQQWGDGDRRVVIEWTEDPLPEFIRQRLARGYNFPVLVWKREDGLSQWPATWALYSLDQIVAMCEANGATREETATAMGRRGQLEQAQPFPRRLTASELKHFASTWRGPHVGIEGMTPRQHLVDARHGFTGDQLTGLSESELLTIHSAHHAGDIEPTTARDATASEAQGSSRAAGALQGRAVIDRLLTWWSANVGGSQASFRWDRTGAQTLPLLRMKAWTPEAIYGRSGMIELAAKGSRLPIDAASLDYRVDGDTIRLRAETTVAASLFGITNEPQSVASAEPVGIAPLAVLSILTTLWQVLHPQCDVTLPGTISATAQMTGETLTVTFTERPSLRIVMLFSFNVAVERVEISRERVRLFFSGSRWIREKVFEVK